MLQNTYGLIAYGRNLLSVATLVSLSICLFGVAQKPFSPFFSLMHTTRRCLEEGGRNKS